MSWLALVLTIVTVASQAAQPSATVVRRYAAPEAGQAVAVDTTHFYAITNARIAKYEKATGTRVAEWSEAPNGPIKHLNSGLILDGQLYAAHSNYPETPMVSSIEIFDTVTLAHVGSHSFGFGRGSATWIEPRGGAWWVVFANYAGKGGEPGRGPEYSTLVRYDREWREQEAWAFPAAVVARWDGMSSSGGVWGKDGLLYTSGHHSTELYVLALPKSSAVLELVRIVPFESEGQGIAVDRDTGLLWSIQRKTREVLVSKLP
jgi:hypothetical protein